MRPLCGKERRLCASLFLLTLAISGKAAAQKKISCSDGEHIEMDLKEIAIKYDASSFSGTLSSLRVLGSRLEVAPKKLQEAAVATQEWNEFLKGLAVGYNTCAVSKQQFAEGVNRIYPRLKEDAADLEEIRKIVSEGRKADEKRLQSLLASYYDNLKRFAQISGKEILLQRIESIAQEVKEVRSGQEEILRRQDVGTETVLEGERAILKKLEEIDQRNKQAPLATPAEVSTEVSKIRKDLLAKADEAETAYQKGYELLERYRFAEAIPYLKQARDAIALADFSLSLGRAYLELEDLGEAERVLREGLELASGKKDYDHEASFASLLGSVLGTKGDLDGALSYAQRALEIDEKVYGPDHPSVARRVSTIAAILYNKGDLDGALSYAQRALKIDEKVYGTEHKQVAQDYVHAGLILSGRGDVDGAFSYAQKALEIVERLNGPDDPAIAVIVLHIADDLMQRGDLDGALTYTQRGLKIDEKVDGPDSPMVAQGELYMAKVLRAKGDFNGALSLAQRALKIDEKAYGPNVSAVARCAKMIGLILHAKRDLEGALSYTQRALKIDEKVYGPDHPTVAEDSFNVGSILLDLRDLDGALKYAKRTLNIDEKVARHVENGFSVRDNLQVAQDAYNIGGVLAKKGDLDGALTYMQRALNILEITYGPGDLRTETLAAELLRLKQAKANQH